MRPGWATSSPGRRWPGRARRGGSGGVGCHAATPVSAAVLVPIPAVVTGTDSVACFGPVLGGAKRTVTAHARPALSVAGQVDAVTLNAEASVPDSAGVPSLIGLPRPVLRSVNFFVANDPTAVDGYASAPGDMPQLA